MDEIGRLINHVGAREPVPAQRFERARQHVHQHWQQVVAEQQLHKRPHRARIFAFAASFVVLVMVSFVFWDYSPFPTVEPIAKIDRVLGKVLIADSLANISTSIGTDTQIETDDDSRIALRMSAGQSVRIDTASRVVVHSSNHLSLKSGAIYIDTSLATEDSPILVSTPLGAAQDIGTQFQVRVNASLLVVGVRQGLVEVSRPGQKSLSINNGQYAKLDANGASETQPIPPGSEDWQWIETVLPEFDIQGASLEEFLGWYARERGLELVWANKASESRARSTILTGSITGLSLDESLQTVKQVAPFEYQQTSKTFWIKVE